MGRMASPGPAASRRSGSRHLFALLLAGILTTTLLACTGDDSSPPEPDAPSDTPLRVSTLTGAGIDEDTRARLESEVSEVLADYVVGSFLGDYPRGDFVQGLADFTNRAAGLAVGDIEQVTASRFEQASSVRAEQLDAELSFLVIDGEAVGASAWVDFDFEVEQDGELLTARLSGRLSLDLRDGRWVVFGYRLVRDDSDAVPVEVSS